MKSTKRWGDSHPTLWEGSLGPKDLQTPTISHLRQLSDSVAFRSHFGSRRSGLPSELDR